MKYSAGIIKQAWSSVIDIFIWDKKLDLLFINDRSPHFNKIKQVIVESCCWFKSIYNILFIYFVCICKCSPVPPWGSEQFEGMCSCPPSQRIPGVTLKLSCSAVSAFPAESFCQPCFVFWKQGQQPQSLS